MDKIDSKLLSTLGLHEIPQGAYNIRKNGQLLGRNSSANIVIESKTDNPGINIRSASNTRGESVHIPVIVTDAGITDLVYNDFFIGENCDVLIVAGCGIHNTGAVASGHDGIHTFHVGKNSRVRYVERHVGEGNKSVEKVLNPVTVVHLGENSTMILETTQLGGVTSSIRKTEADLDKNAVLDIRESILTDFEDRATTEFHVSLNGAGARANVVSRSVAKGNSFQRFDSNVEGNCDCTGHVECDAIVMDRAQVVSMPALKNTDSNASLTHEAAIGKIAGEQIVKLETLGLTQEEAEALIIKGFLS